MEFDEVVRCKIMNEKNGLQEKKTLKLKNDIKDIE